MTSTTSTTVPTTVTFNDDSSHEETDDDSDLPDSPVYSDIMMPLLISAAVLILVCAVVCFTKRRRAQQASQGTSTAITAVSGGVPMNAAAYSNYNNRLATYLSNQGQGTFNQIIESPDLPPSYEEAVLASQSPNAADKDIDGSPPPVYEPQVPSSHSPEASNSAAVNMDTGPVSTVVHSASHAGDATNTSSVSQASSVPSSSSPSDLTTAQYVNSNASGTPHVHVTEL